MQVNARKMSFVLGGMLVMLGLTPLAAAVPASGSERQSERDPTSGEQIIVVVGASGEEEYAAEFSQWVDGWRTAADRQDWEWTLVGGTSADEHSETHRQQLRTAIESSAAVERLWIVLIGHGTYSTGGAKFNLEGPDFAAKELSEWLKPVSAPVVLVNCTSASAPFMIEVKAPRRIVLTATRSGSEINFARFGKYLASAINDPAADIDHDREVSLLEAFLAASSQTERFYREDARLATEHALLDDNGDGVGTSGDFYRGIQPVKRPQADSSLDGAVAARVILFTSPDVPEFSEELTARRDLLEQQIDDLRQSKASMSEEEYLNQLESLLLQMSELYKLAESTTE